MKRAHKDFEDFCQRVLAPLRLKRPEVDSYHAGLLTWRWVLAQSNRTEADVMIEVAMRDPKWGDLLAHCERIGMSDVEALATLGLMTAWGFTEGEAISHVTVYAWPQV